MEQFALLLEAKKLSEYRALSWIEQYTIVLKSMLSVHIMETGPDFPDKEILLEMERLKLRLARKTLERIEAHHG